MKFKTPQAQEAYQEVLRELVQAIKAMEADSRAQEERFPENASAIAISTIYRVADIRLDGIERAIRVGSDVDLRWGALAAHLTMQGYHG
jgi:hypothetical protein